MAQVSDFSETQQTGNGWTTGKLVTSKTIGDKRHWYPVVYAPDPSAELIEIPRDVWETYCEDRDAKKGIPARKISKDGDPLFYLVDENEQVRFIGPTMMFRVPYKNRITDLLPSSHRDPEVIDFAQAMFGLVSGSDKAPRRAYASRVSVTDARLAPGQTNVLEEIYAPPILSGPKATTFQHYLEQPHSSKTQREDPKDLVHYDGKNARLRGQKLYWRRAIQHMKDIAGATPSSPPANDTQRTALEPVRRGVNFTFRVYFDNLTEVELGALSWALTLGSDNHNRHHQLGMGKPFGMGVVRLEPKLRLIRRQERYSSLFTGWEGDSIYEDDLRISKFESFMSNRNVVNYTDIRKQLDAMLTVYAPNADFSYMQLGEFKKRPVLPTPTEVVADIPLSSDTLLVRQRKAAAPKKDVLEVGAILRGQVDSIDVNGDVYFIPNLAQPITKKVSALVLCDYEHPRWQKNDRIKAIIVNIVERKNEIEVHCRPLDKGEG